MRDQVFISYSHRDRKWLQRLRTALRPYVRNGTVTAWVDEEIKPGANWKDKIQNALSQTKVAVLLVSQSFLASDFIAVHELAPLLNAAKADGVVVIWIPITASSYTETDIQNYQAVHDPAYPLDSLSPAKRNQALVAICEAIKAALNHLSNPPQFSIPLAAGPKEAAGIFAGIPRVSLVYEVLRTRETSPIALVNGKIRVDGTPIDWGQGALTPDELHVRAQFLAARVGLHTRDLNSLGDRILRELVGAGPLSRDSLISRIGFVPDLPPSSENAPFAWWQASLLARIRNTDRSPHTGHARWQMADDPILHQLPDRLCNPQLSYVETPFPWLPRLALDRVYTELALTPLSLSIAQDEASGAGRRRVSRFDSVPLSFALDRLRGWTVVVGDPGSGKTTFLRAFAAGLISRPHGRFMLPILIPLREYWLTTYEGRRRTVSGRGGRLLHFFLDRLGIRTKTLVDLWEHRLSRWSVARGDQAHFRDTALFLLDGWDEVPPEGREQVQRDIQEVMPLAQGVITSRPSGAATRLPVQHCFELAGLDQDGTATLIRRWFVAIGRPKQAEGVIRDIRRHADLEQMSTNPFLLTLICGIGYNPNSPRASRLPQSRAHVYRKTIDVIFSHSPPDRTLPIVTDDQRQALERFALWLSKDAEGAPLYVFSRENFDNRCGRPGELRRCWEVRRLLTSTVSSPHQFQFIHATFQEYLAASAWIDRESAGFEEAAQQGVFNLQWLEVLKFAASQKPGKSAEFWMALRAVSTRPDRFGFVLARIARAVAGSAEVRGSSDQFGIDLREELWRRYYGSKRSWAVDSIYIDALVDLDANYLVDRLVSAIAKTRGERRNDLLRAFDRIPSAYASAPLSRLIQTGSPRLRAAVSQYADKLDEAALDEFRVAARSARKGSSRIRALRVLAYARNKHDIPLLAEIASRDPDEDVAAEAIQAIGDIGGDEAACALGSLFVSETDESRLSYIAYALGGADCASARDRLLAELAARAPDDPIVPSILEGLNGMPIPIWGQLVVPFLDARWPDDIRFAAAHALAECTDTSIHDPIAALARDDGASHDLREVALQLLLSRREPSHCGWLRKRFNERHRPPSERARLMEVLIETAHQWGWFSEGEEVWAAAIACTGIALKRPDTQIAEVAARNAHLLGRDMIPVLVRLLKSRRTSNPVRYAACESIGMLGSFAAGQAATPLAELLISHRNKPKNSEHGSSVTDRMIAEAAADALARIAPLRLLQVGGQLADDALSRVAADAGMLVFDDRIIDAAGRELVDEADSESESR